MFAEGVCKRIIFYDFMNVPVDVTMDVMVGSTRIRLVKGDITEQSVDAIVNAANPSLMGGGGVDGAIHRKGGPTILEECKHIRHTLYPEGLPVGKSVITSGGNLKARYVIHTVGPIWQGGSHGESELLAEAYQNSLKLALEKGLKTVAFPSISTGAYNYPLQEASSVALRAINDFVDEKMGLREILLVLFNNAAFQVYREAMKNQFKVQLLESRCTPDSRSSCSLMGYL